jgi:hypothetical protein
MKGAENMDYKKAVSDTLNGMKGSFRPESDAEFGRKIKERAKIMSNNNENTRQMNFREVTSEYVEPKKSHKALNVFAGVAGTAAVLAGAVFGLKWLNDNGGLKGPDVSGPGAGYSANSDATAADADDNEFTTIFQSYSINGSGYVKVDQKYGVGDDLTVHLKGYKFDGTLALIYYDLIYKDEIVDGLSSMPIRPKDSDIGHFESCQFGGGGTLFSCFVTYRFDTPADQADVTFGYSDDPQSEIFGLTMFKSTDVIDDPISTTATYMTVPDDVETTTAIALLPDSPDADTTTTVIADDVEGAVTSAIALDFPDADTTNPSGVSWEGVTSLGFKDKDINMTAFRYDGRFLEARLVGKEEDLCRVGVRSSTRARNIIHSTGRYDEETGSAVFYALLDVPAGEYDNIEFIDFSTLSEVGYPVAGSSMTIKGIDNYEPLMERVGVDMTEFGIPDATLEWMTLSPVGLEMSFTSRKQNALSSNIRIERTTLNGTVVPFSGFYASTVYNEKTGLYHASMVVVPDDYNVDLTEMKEFSINGLKTKRAEFMSKTFWDLSSEPDMNEMQPVETAVQMSIPEQ